MNKDEEAEMAEARAMLERNRARIAKQYAIDAATFALEALPEGQSMLNGPTTELELRRILRDIKESGDGD
jgi:hypothetical protein